MSFVKLIVLSSLTLLGITASAAESGGNRVLDGNMNALGL